MTNTATFAGGCFWCTEAIFKRINGVISVVSGYTGGNVEKPSYEEVSSKLTGHAEAINIEFNPEEITYETLVEIFLKTHDPTTLNQQGNDIGPQYRSAIFYHDNAQKECALNMIEKLEKENYYRNKIVTSVEEFSNFYEAENYHQNFYDNNVNYPYCNIVIDPKIEKLLQKFPQHIKKD